MEQKVKGMLLDSMLQSFKTPDPSLVIAAIRSVSVVDAHNCIRPQLLIYMEVHWYIRSTIGCCHGNRVKQSQVATVILVLGIQIADTVSGCHYLRTLFTIHIADVTVVTSIYAYKL